MVFAAWARTMSPDKRTAFQFFFLILDNTEVLFKRIDPIEALSAASGRDKLEVETIPTYP
jgi:hypothetical protein